MSKYSFEESENTGISAFNTLIASKSLKATYAIGTNLVDSSAAYPTLANLNALKTAGNDIVAYSTDAATVTAGTAEANAAAAKAFITTNNFDSNVIDCIFDCIFEHLEKIIPGLV